MIDAGAVEGVRAIVALHVDPEPARSAASPVAARGVLDRLSART